MKHELKTLFCKVVRRCYLWKIVRSNLVRCPKKVGENRESREANRCARANPSDAVV
jgi:hypothetical protein